MRPGRWMLLAGLAAALTPPLAGCGGEDDGELSAAEKAAGDSSPRAAHRDDLATRASSEALHHGIDPVGLGSEKAAVETAAGSG